MDPRIEPGKSQYVQIADLLGRRIDDGNYPPGSALPSEPDLAQELGVSRVPLNKAVSLLRSSGQVKVRRGSGTFVRRLSRIVRDAVNRFAARAEGTGAGQVEVARLGLRPRTEYRNIGRVTPPERVAEILG